MRAVVFGYHTMGCLGLDALQRHGFSVPAVFTHRDDPHEEIWWESLADRAASRGIPVHYPEKAEMGDPAFAARVAGYAPDFLFSFYFRFMIPPQVLALAPRGALNLHGSLLPRYRGRAPVNWVLVEGQSETGVTLHHMVAKPDAGAIVDQERVAIDFEDTALSLFRKLEPAAVRLLDRALPRLAAGTAEARPMDLAAGCYRGGRRPEDGRIDWSWPARRIYDLVRAVTHPYPGAFTETAGGRLLVWWAVPIAEAAAGTRRAPGTLVDLRGDEVRVATGDGLLALRRCQRVGSEEGDAAAVLRSLGMAPGMRLGAAG